MMLGMAGSPQVPGAPKQLAREKSSRSRAASVRDRTTAQRQHQACDSSAGLPRCPRGRCCYYCRSHQLGHAHLPEYVTGFVFPTGTKRSCVSGIDCPHITTAHDSRQSSDSLAVPSMRLCFLVGKGWPRVQIGRQFLSNVCVLQETVALALAP